MSKLPELNRYPNNEELFKMVVALTDNLNKANKTIASLKRKINLKTKSVDILEFLNDNVVPTVTSENLLSAGVDHIFMDKKYEDDDSSSEEEEETDKNDDDMITMAAFYSIGFYSFSMRCLKKAMKLEQDKIVNISSSGVTNTNNSFLEEEEEDIEDIASGFNNLDIDDTEEKEDMFDIVDTKSDSLLSFVPPILCFKQKKDNIFTFENNCWSQSDISVLTVNNIFNRFSCLVHSKIIKLFGEFKERHEHELYEAQFQTILSSRLKSICSINMDHKIVTAKIIKPWYNSNKIDLYEFMNINS